MNGHEAHAQSRFALRSLGVVDLRGPDDVALGSVLVQPKRFALLVYLLLAGSRDFHRRDSLLAIFWPELNQTRARAALRQALHFLRQALGSDVLLGRGTEEIGVAPDRIRCDVDEFDHAVTRGHRETAVRLYRGAFLDGLHVNETPEFERWVARERERLGRTYAHALETLAKESRDRHDLSSAIEYLRALAHHEPYAAETTVKLMRVLADSGDRASALAQARAYADRVTRDLELAPDPLVTDFADRLRCAEQPVGVEPRVDPATRGPRSAKSGPPPAPSQPMGRATRRALAAVAITVFAVPIIWIAALKASALASDEPLRASVGIMPFGSGGDPSLDFIAQGLSRAVVRSLRDLRAIRVLGPEDTRGLVSDEGFGRRSIDQLDVQYVLRSEILPSDTDGLRVAPVLIRTASQDTVWGDTLNAGPHDLVGVPGRIAERIAEAMGITLLPAERRLLSAPVTSDPDAYVLYLRGNQRLRNAVTRGDELLAAVSLLERAVRQDTAFALAYAQLAVAHLSLYWWHRDQTPERLNAAKAAADAVMRLRPDLPDAHLAMGWFHYWGSLDYDRALSHFEMARATRSPNSDLMILLGAMRRRQGDWAGSTSLYEQALHDNPTCAWCAMDLGYSRLVLGQYAHAAAAFRQAVSLSPDFFYGQVFGALLEIAWRGDTARARTWIHLDSFDANEVIQTGTRHWAVLGRVLGPGYDEVLGRTRLTPAVDDTAEYYLAKAQLFAGRGPRGASRAYYDSAAVWLETRVIERTGEARTHALLGLAYAGQGRAEEAVAAGSRAVALVPPMRDAMDGPLWMVRLAEINVNLGRLDAAVDLLEQVVAMPSWVTPALLRVDPVWAPLWGHPRFEHLASSP